MADRIEEARTGSAQELFTVPVQGDAIDALRMHARSDGISPEEWIARLAERQVRTLADAAMDEGDAFAPERPCSGLGN